MRFRIKAGRHMEEGVAYGKNEEAGNVVDSPHDLVKLFPEKFENTGEEGDQPPDTTALVGTVTKDTPDTKKSGGVGLEAAPRVARAGFPGRKINPPPPSAEDDDAFFGDEEPAKQRRSKSKTASRRKSAEED